jgi:hypothetical protein
VGFHATASSSRLGLTSVSVPMESGSWIASAASTGNIFSLGENTFLNSHDLDFEFANYSKATQYVSS